MWQIVGAVFFAGCVGGLFNGLLAEKRGLRYLSTGCDTYFPGTLGNVLTGGVAALVFWGLYGPFSGATILPPGAAGSEPVTLKIGELASSILIGIGGPGFLRAEAGRRCAERRLLKERALSGGQVQTVG
jgi:hypothetical protein